MQVNRFRFFTALLSLLEWRNSNLLIQANGINTQFISPQFSLPQTVPLQKAPIFPPFIAPL